MVVNVEKDIFIGATSEKDKVQLSFLLYLVVFKTCFTLSIKDDISESAFYKEMPNALKNVVDDAFTTTIAMSLKPDCCIGVGYEFEKEERFFSLAEALVFLMEPSSIIIENGLNDSYFIDALFRCYDSTGDMLHFVENGWLQYDNAGGCGNVINFIQARVNHYQGKTKFLKCFVIVDSDKRYKGQNSGKYDSLEKKLKDWGVPYHILEKRSMENYMPILVMNSLRKRTQREWVAAYGVLDATQRDYLSIAGGFSEDVPKREKELLIEEIKRFRKRKSRYGEHYFINTYLDSKRKALYSNVSNGNFVHLAFGFPVNGVFKEVFPRYYQSPLVNRSGFDAISAHQDNPNELRSLVNKLIQLM